MTTDRALDILSMSEQARWKEGIEPEDVNEAVETIRNKLSDNVLDKIRAEIEENAYPIVHGVNNHEKGMTLYGILQVIDKYRESEGEK